MELCELLQHTGRGMGITVSKSHRRGSSDANFFGAAGVPTLDGFGPICGDDHTENEWIRVSSIIPRTALLAYFLISAGIYYLMAESPSVFLRGALAALLIGFLEGYRSYRHHD